MSGKKKRNSSKAKVVYRKRIADLLPSSAKVLECFAGEGHIYRMCWASFQGVTIDKDELSARDASRERTSWAVYQGDTRRALADGLASRTSFDVVDVDCYGEPWPFVKAFFSEHKEYPACWWLVCTDGYASQRNTAAGSKTLFGGEGRLAGVGEQDYIKSGRGLVRVAAERQGLKVFAALSFTKNHGVGNMWSHIFLLGTEPRKDWIDAARGWSSGDRSDEEPRR